MTVHARDLGYPREVPPLRPEFLGEGDPVPVTFFWAGDEDPYTVEGWDPEADWTRFTSCSRVWVLQTYLRLRNAGYPVAISRTVPRSGILVYHGEHSSALRRQGLAALSPTLVAIRGDRRSALLADYQIHQNGRRRGSHQLMMPHWPQPGLVERDPGRGTRVRRVAFKGFAENLHPEFRGAVWADELGAMGLEWVVQARRFGYRHEDLFASWADFSDIDLIVAVRPSDHHLWKSKPASKLINSWMAGVPAILGPEYAYRELRRSELDFIEASSAMEVRAAIRRLIDRPDLYDAMVRNGLERAREFEPEMTDRQWAELLYKTLPSRIAGWRARLARTTAARLMRLVTWHPDLSDLASYCHPSVVAVRLRDRLPIAGRDRSDGE